MSNEWKDKDEEPTGNAFLHWWALAETPEQKAARVEREQRTRATNELMAEHSTPLPPFVAEPECPKCGSLKVKCGYGHYREAPAMNAPVFERVGFQPYLSLECRRCNYGSNAQCGGFIWVMAPKDAK